MRTAWCIHLSAVIWPCDLSLLQLRQCNVGRFEMRGHMDQGCVWIHLKRSQTNKKLFTLLSANGSSPHIVMFVDLGLNIWVTTQLTVVLKCFAGWATSLVCSWQNLETPCSSFHHLTQTSIQIRILFSNFLSRRQVVMSCTGNLHL